MVPKNLKTRIFTRYFKTPCFYALNFVLLGGTRKNRFALPAGLHSNWNVDSVACCHLTLPLPLPLMTKTPQRRRPIESCEVVAESKDYLILNVHFAHQCGGATIFWCIGTGTFTLDEQKDVHGRRAP